MYYFLINLDPICFESARPYQRIYQAFILVDSILPVWPLWWNPDEEKRGENFKYLRSIISGDQINTVIALSFNILQKIDQKPVLIIEPVQPFISFLEIPMILSSFSIWFAIREVILLWYKIHFIFYFNLCNG